MTLLARHEPEPQIADLHDAQRLIADLGVAMDNLIGILAEESSLVRAGRLAEARHLAEEKGDLAAAYTRLMLVARDEVSTLARLMPAETEALKRRHELFRAEVQINLAVLATARDVAEDLMRSVANDVAEPQGGAYGRRGAQVPVGSAASGLLRDRRI
jgi:hypothetical protein